MERVENNVPVGGIPGAELNPNTHYGERKDAGEQRVSSPSEEQKGTGEKDTKPIPEIIIRKGSVRVRNIWMLVI